MSHSHRIWTAKLELSNINHFCALWLFRSICKAAHQEASHIFTLHKFVQGKIKLKKQKTMA